MRTFFLRVSKYIFLMSFVTALCAAGSAQIVAQESEENCIKLFADCRQFNQKCAEFAFVKSLAPNKIDNFGITNYEDEISYLESFAVVLRDRPKATGFIVIYGGKMNKYGELKERTRRITSHLTEILKLNAQRFVTINGGFREKFEVELWTADLPNAYPPLSPTIDVEKVIFRGKMKPLTTSY